MKEGGFSLEGKESDAPQFLVHAVGIMKGFIFLLPLGQMKQFFKDADNARKEGAVFSMRCCWGCRSSRSFRVGIQTDVGCAANLS